MEELKNPVEREAAKTQYEAAIAAFDGFTSQARELRAMIRADERLGAQDIEVLEQKLHKKLVNHLGVLGTRRAATN